MRLTRELQGVSGGLWPADPDLGTIGSYQRGSVPGPPGSLGLWSASASLGRLNEFTNLLAYTTQKVILSHFGALKSEISTAILNSRCRRAHTPAEGCVREGSFSPLLASGAPSVPWLVAASLHCRPPSSHGLLPLCPCVFPSAYKDTRNLRVIGFRAQPNSRMISSHDP